MSDNLTALAAVIEVGVPSGSAGAVQLSVFMVIALMIVCEVAASGPSGEEAAEGCPWKR